MCYNKKTIEQAKKVFIEDEIFGPIAEKITLDVPPGTNDVYAYLIRVIIFQQLSGKAANTIYQRFLDLFPQKYPEKEILTSLNHDQLRSVGLSNQKAKYVKNIANWFIEKESIEWDKLNDHEVRDLLLPIKGVGPWTIDMLLMFGLCRQDIMPSNDLGINTAIIQLYGLNKEDKKLKKKIDKITSKWKPFRSIACLYLWRYLDDQKQK